MKIRLALLLLIVVAAFAIPLFARPVVIHETQALTTPDAARYPDFGFSVATNGEYALIGGLRRDGPILDSHHHYALLYRRVNGQWTFVREQRYVLHEADSYIYPSLVAMRGDLAAIELSGNTHAFRLVGGEWIDEGSIGGPGEDLSVDGGRILHAAGDSHWNGRIWELANGAWTATPLTGQPRGSDDEFWGGPLDLLGDRAILGTPYTNDLEPQEIPIYQRFDLQNWALLGKIQVPGGTHRLLGEVALQGDNAIVDGVNGPYYWRLPELGAPRGRLQPLDAYRANETSSRVIQKSGELVGIIDRSVDRDTGVVNLFRANTSGGYDHVAVLAPDAGSAIGGSVDIAGNVVIVSGRDRAHVFDLPASFAAPAVTHEEFEDTGAAARWQPTAGSNFALITVDGQRVYRQTSQTGDAASFRVAGAGADHSIEAEISPLAMTAGATRWVGLATRQTDIDNYYYVTLRNNATVELKRRANGVYLTLAAASVPVVLNGRNRLRLQSIGSEHRVYVNGRQFLLARDSTHAQGRVGLLTYNAAANFDNVIVTGSPHTTIFDTTFAADSASGEPWTHTGTGQWSFDPAGGVRRQTSIAGDARAIIGTAATDIVVDVGLTPTAFAAGTGDPWVGAMLRYVDDSNYTYVSLRRSNKLSLRRLVNGQIQILAEAPLTVTPGQRYLLHVETVGGAIRAYVDGFPAALLKASLGADAPPGRVGILTYRGSADFGDFRAYQP
jgi:hypothetical protein